MISMSWVVSASHFKARGSTGVARGRSQVIYSGAPGAINARTPRPHRTRMGGKPPMVWAAPDAKTKNAGACNTAKQPPKHHAN